MTIFKILIVVLISVSASKAGWSQNWEYCWSNDVCRSKQECLNSVNSFLVLVVIFTSIWWCLWSLIKLIKHCDVKRKYRKLARNRIETDLRRRNKSGKTIESISNTFLKMDNHEIETNNVLRDEINTIGMTFKSRNEILSGDNLPGVKLIKESAKRKSFLELKNDMIKMKKPYLNSLDINETTGFDNFKRYFWIL